MRLLSRAAALIIGLVLGCVALAPWIGMAFVLVDIHERFESFVATFVSWPALIASIFAVVLMNVIARMNRMRSTNS